MGKNTQVKVKRIRTKKLLREFSAGGVVFKKNKNLWLITLSTPSANFPGVYWRLPKGWLDDDEAKMKMSYPGPLARGERKPTEEELHASALREVREEGGIEAKILSSVGTISYPSFSPRGRVLKFSTFYLMEWVKDLPEGPDFETTEVTWVTFDNAVKTLTSMKEREILKKAKKVLESL